MIDKAAVSWGRIVGRYARAVVTDANVRQIKDTPLPGRPAIWIGWHEANLVTIALHRFIVRRPAMCIVSHDLRGHSLRGWLEALGVEPVVLFPGIQAGPALGHIRDALKSGSDVLVAGDGPRGPRYRIKPGALWLAAQSGVPILPVGCAASWACRLPRWDRLIVPLPGTRIVAVYGSEVALPSDVPFSVVAARIEDQLHGLTARARAALAEPPCLANTCFRHLK